MYGIQPDPSVRESALYFSQYIHLYISRTRNRGGESIEKNAGVKMARQINIVLIATLLASARVIEGASISDWVNEFTNNLTYNINNMVREINHRVNQQIATVNKNVQDMMVCDNNIPRDSQGNIITTSSGGSIITSINGAKVITIIDGISEIITSYTENGEPYVSDVVQKRIGNMVYCNKTITNQKTGVSKTTAWEVNLATPGSKPEIITNTDTNTDKSTNTKTDEK